MDDITLFAKNEKGLETLIFVVRIYCQDIGIEYGKEKCSLQIMKSEKRHMTEGMELTNQEKNKNARGKVNLQILGNIGSRHHQTSEYERKNQERVS